MRIRCLGCDIDNLTMEETIAEVEKCINSRTPHQHVVVNADKIVKAHRDQTLKAIINCCDLINADGMSVVWASRLLGTPLKERVAGIDLFLALLERAERAEWRVYLLGAREASLRKMLETLRKKHPRLKIAGYRHGYWDDGEEGKLVNEIKAACPDILFLGMSSPKKEYFVDKYLKELCVPFVMGVGGSFDVVAGKVRRAPEWSQRMGLEWLYRFFQEPRRMWKRYLINNVHFCVLLLKEILFYRKKTKRREQ